MTAGYHCIRSIGRDFEAENNLELQWRAPLSSELEELQALLQKGADAIGVKWQPPQFPEVILTQDLSKQQREALDSKLLGRYASALAKDEEPRETFTFMECGERMADLRAAAISRNLRVMWSCTPFNSACGEFGGKPRIFWVRESIAESFLKVIFAYNQMGLTPHVEDCFRPPAVQEGLYRRRVKLVRQENPGFSNEQVLLEAEAKTAHSPHRAAHMAGAAIDFTLREEDGQPLDLGNPYPTGGAATNLHFPYVTWAQFRTRCLFSEISTMCGLFPYPGEDWHVSGGDGLGAILEGISTVRYCALRDFDRVSGEIVPFPVDEARKDFSYEGLL